MSITLALLEDVVREAGTIALSYFNDLKNVEVNKKVLGTLLQPQMLPLKHF